MRIAVWHNTGAGGARRHLFSHVRGLLGRGHEIESWCPDSATADYLPLGELVREHRTPLGWERRNRRGWLSSTAGLIVDPCRMLRAVDSACRAAAEAINGERFDLLLATNCIFSSVAPIARYVECPTVMYLHEPRRSLYEGGLDMPWVAPVNPPGRAGPPERRAWRWRRFPTRDWKPFRN